MQVPAAASSASEAAAPQRRAGSTRRLDGAGLDAATEVDLRGLRADEVVARLQPALDAAIQADLPSLRIIHGKGTGALREVVTELLKRGRPHPLVPPGRLGEGGTGVTVAELR
jgi:DNA mismatch repair protein MutS2